MRNYETGKYGVKRNNATNTRSLGRFNPDYKKLELDLVTCFKEYGAPNPKKSANEDVGRIKKEILPELFSRWCVSDRESIALYKVAKVAASDSIFWYTGWEKLTSVSRLPMRDIRWGLKPKDATCGTQNLDERELDGREIFYHDVTKWAGSLPSRHFIQGFLDFKKYPIYDQGGETRCVSFSLATMVTYYTGLQISVESVVDFHDACPHTNRGIVLNDALARASRDGYTIGAESVKLPGHKALEVADINSWKEELANNNPIIASFQLTCCSYRSFATRATGKIYMPFPHEEYADYHVMLVVGYVDDPDAPGGGYFIARNVQGTNWARDSVIGLPGHALIPYKYAQLYSVVAYAGSQNKDDSPSYDNPMETGSVTDGVKQEDNCETKPQNDRQHDDWERQNSTREVPYVFSLRKDAYDYEGEELVKTGARVIAHPDSRDKFKRYSETNYERFVNNGYAWTDEQKVKNYFPQTDEVKTRFEDERKERKRFEQTVESNLNEAFVLDSPWGKPGFWGGTPKLENATWQPVEFTALRPLGAPGDLTIPDDLLAFYSPSNAQVARVLDSKKQETLLLSVYLAPVRVSPCERPRIVTPDLALLESLAAEFKRNHDGKAPQFVLLGSRESLANVPWQNAFGDAPVALWSPSGAWQKNDAASIGANAALTRFVDALCKTPTVSNAQRVAAAIERKVAGGYMGYATKELVARWTDLTSKEVEEAFAALVRSGGYERAPSEPNAIVKRR